MTVAHGQRLRTRKLKGEAWPVHSKVTFGDVNAPGFIATRKSDGVTQEACAQGRRYVIELESKK